MVGSRKGSLKIFLEHSLARAGSLQINCEIFITYSQCIHVLFESCMINSLGKIMGSTGGVSMFHS